MNSLIKKPLLALLTISVYLFAFISAIIVSPYISITISVIYLIIGVYILSNHLYANKGLIGVVISTNSIFIGLGQYLEFYLPLASFVTNIIGVILSIISVVIFYYWKEGQKHVAVRIKNERLDEHQPKESFWKKIKVLFILIKKQRKFIKEKGYPKLLALQFAYVEYQEEQAKSQEKNALDFFLGREVILQRNEYDQSIEK